MAHGDPIPPAGGFSVEAGRLVTAGGRWDDLSAGLSTAHGHMAEGAGRPFLFGVVNELAGIGRQHLAFNTAVTAALSSGSTAAAHLANGLVETANDYSDTDVSQAANFSEVP
ncbi:MAG TPA: hypothetical protein VGE77_06255 [Nocardioides sp.]